MFWIPTFKINILFDIKKNPGLGNIKPCCNKIASILDLNSCNYNSLDFMKTRQSKMGHHFTFKLGCDILPL